MTRSLEHEAAEAPSAGESVPLASRYIRSLLNRHEVPSSRHVTSVAQILDMGYTLVYRRMKGVVAWELEEIEVVARHFGETLADVFADEAADDYEPAVLAVGGLRLPCRVIAGSVSRDPPRNSLVTVKIGEQWLVVPASEAGAAPAFDVRRLNLSGPTDRRWRVAVIDDDAVETASLQAHFEDRGCDVEAFTKVENLIEHLKARPFDAYVIDWMLGEGSAAELVAMIRSEDPHCPIAVLTGKMRSDVLLEPAMAEAVSTYRLLFFEKPTRLAIISAQLLQALAGR
jgi:CheY-like chemotaxis protein